VAGLSKGNGINLKKNKSRSTFNFMP